VNGRRLLRTLLEGEHRSQGKYILVLTTHSYPYSQIVTNVEYMLPESLVNHFAPPVTSSVSSFVNQYL